MLEQVKAGISERLGSPARAGFITLWITDAAIVVVFIAIAYHVMARGFPPPTWLIVLFGVLSVLSYAQQLMIKRTLRDGTPSDPTP
jgi:hypothetical protein